MFTRMVRKQDNKKQKRISSSTIAVIGSVILLTGGFFLSYNYMQSKKVKAFDYMANVFYQSEEVEILEHDGELQQEQKEEELGEVTNDYIGYLTIPKLNLTKGFLDMRSEYNNIEQNITVIKGSSYPDKEKGNFIIAAHSGSGWKAFFNDLYKLSTGDIAEVSYKGKKYTYKIVNIYKQDKTGTIAIYRNYDKTTLTLVTCTNFDSKTQTVYIAELQNVVEE
ncbi:MAG: sortase [Bacilli bacterium]|nr:sortase [Bacilli bacterium]